MSRRYDNLERWQQIADGELTDAEANTDSLFAWLQERAKEIVKADGAKDRDRALLRAVALPSRTASLEPLRWRLEVLDSFPFADDQGDPREPTSRERTRARIALVRAEAARSPEAAVSLDVNDQTTDEEIRKRLDRMFARGI